MSRGRIFLKRYFLLIFLSRSRFKTLDIRFFRSSETCSSILTLTGLKKPHFTIFRLCIEKTFAYLCVVSTYFLNWICLFWPTSRFQTLVFFHLFCISEVFLSNSTLTNMKNSYLHIFRLYFKQISSPVAQARIFWKKSEFAIFWPNSRFKS